MSSVPDPKDQLSPVKRALIELRDMRARLDAAEQAKNEPIAIVGMGLRLPGAISTADGFWDLLREGRHAITEVPDSRWDAAAYFDSDADAPGKMSTRFGGFLDAVDQFDPHFFGITPREAFSMDPQQRLLLEVSWEALEHAGLAPRSLAGSATGVFVGLSNIDYYRMVYADQAAIDGYSASGTSGSVAAGRLSYTLGLQGPSLAVDTACSSSLTAVHLACQALRLGECTLALAGGANVILSPDVTIACSKSHMMAADGLCKTFDARADGYVRSEGCGVVVLKRVSDAVRDRDRIVAVIRGSAVNQDGRSSGLTVPNGPAQEAVIRRALANAGVHPADVAYVEAHGTGTSLGDPIEVRALGNVFGANRPAERPLVVGSVKANVGHLEAAAGITGLIKVALAFEHGEIPGHPHLQERNPHLDWSVLPLIVPGVPMPWPADQPSRIAGVSSFGFSGTNVHVVLEQAPPLPPLRAGRQRTRHVLAISARTSRSLDESAARYARYAETAAADFGDICFSANTGRVQDTHRLVVVAASAGEAAGLLAHAGRGHEHPGVVRGVAEATEPPPIAFLFTGQGSHYAGMGRALYEAEPVFRDAVNRCAELLQPLMDRSLLSLILAPGDVTWTEDTAYTQPALFALEYALAQLWRSWGIEPAAVMGHSVGEVVAACVAGIFSLEDGLTLVAARGRLMQQLADDGEMVSVLGDPASVRIAMAPHGDVVSIAAVNGPGQCVISGVRVAVAAIGAELEARGLKVQRLTTARAFHSALMNPALDELEAVAGCMRFAPPTVPLVSTVTGELARPDDLMSAAYWRRQARDTVRFHQATETLLGLGHRLFVEVGPAPTLLGMAARFVDAHALFVPSLRQGRDDAEVMLTSLGTLYTQGAAVNWTSLYPRDAHHIVAVPTSPFERQRYWIPERKAAAAAGEVGGDVHPLLGRRIASPVKETLFAHRLDIAALPYLADHVIFGAVVFPGAGYFEAAAAAAAAIFGHDRPAVEDLVITEPLRIPAAGCSVQTVVTPDGGGRAALQFFSREGTAEDPSWRLHAAATIGPRSRATEAVTDSLDDARRRCREVRDVSSHYDAVQRSGVAPGPAFRAVTDLWRGDGEAVGRIQLAAPSSADGYLLHPALLDSCMQVLLAALPGGAEALTDGAFHLPVGLEQLRVQGPAGASVWAHGRLRAAAPGAGETYTGDVRIFDAEGALVAELTGLSAKRATAGALGAALRPVRKDWLYELAWQPAPARALSSTPNLTGTWVLCVDEHGAGALLAERLRGQGGRVVRVARTDGEYVQDERATPAVRLDPAIAAHWQRLLDFAAADAGRPVAGIVYAWDVDLDVPADLNSDWIRDHVRRSGEGLLLLAQQLAGCQGSSVRLWVVTRGATGSATAALANGPKWGLARAIATEHPDLRCVCVDLDIVARDTDAEQVWRELMAPDGEDQVAFASGGRQVARLRRAGGRAVESALPTAADVLRPDASYLITGGLGALGLRLATALVERGARHIVLTGRRGPTASAAAVIADLEQAGASVVVMCGDVSRADDVADVLRHAALHLPPLRGVIHAAGVIDDGVVLQQEWARFERVLAPKVAGAWHLHELTKTLPLDFFVLFSSAAAVIGSPGQSSYATANTFLDALARYRRASGLPGLSIGWGPWAEAGMAADLADRERQRWQRHGIEVMPPKDCLAILDRLWRQPAAHVAVLAADWQVFAAETGAHADLPLLRDLVGPLRAVRNTAASGLGHSALVERLANAPASRRRELLTSHVREQVKHVLALDASFSLEPHQGLRDIGMDSLTALELRNRLQRSVGQPLPATLTFDHPTVAALSEYLATAVLQVETTADETTAVAASMATAIDAGEPIAIIGLGCRFPGGASDPDSFWQLLIEGTHAISDVPSDRWDVEALYDPDPDAPGKMYTRRGGFLDRVDGFDPQFFGVSRREAVSLDPQHRLLLEVAWEALEHAAQPPDALMGTRTGVFVGISSFDYAMLHMKRPNPSTLDAYYATGTSMSVAAGRIAYTLGLQGPCLSVDTACSSSLVAVHLACRSLRGDECRLALVGGVNLMLAPEMTVNGCRARMLAADGRCKTFDADADGYARSEGAAVLVLKRLSDALQDNDRVLAVIRGTAINQDGRSSGLTVPNGPAQQAVIREALLDAGVAAAQVGYVEAHGTGTALGDPIEVDALKAVFGAHRAAEQPLVVGSVKTNIGHLEAAAGLASVVKTVLTLQHEEIPPHLHFRSLNPHISLGSFPMVIPTERRAWRAGDQPRIAGVSSFGFSGTNAHVVIEESPVSKAAAAPAAERPLHVLALSAKSDQALGLLAARHAEHLGSAAEDELANVAFTINAGRAHFSHRLAIAASTASEARAALSAYGAGRTHPALTTGTATGDALPQVAFLFTGQGSQYPGMGRQLFETQPTFRAALLRCDAILRPWLDVPLLSVLYPTDGASADRINRTVYTQPALFALEFALAELWRSWGVQPAALLGHSVGEYVAACLAGVFTLEAGLMLIAARARLMQALPPGGMAAVFADAEQVAVAIRSREPLLSIAAVNGDRHTVVSGDSAALSDLLAELDRLAIRTERLQVSHAFHSALMEPMLDEFDRIASEVEFAAPRIPLASNLTGMLAGPEIATADYWRRHVRAPVRFSDGIAVLREQGCTHFLEIGPKPTLIAMARRAQPDRPAAWLPSLRPGRDDWAEMLGSLASLYTAGAAIDWPGFDQPYPRRKLALPTYPFQRERFWLDERRAAAPDASSRLADSLYGVEWREKPRQPGTSLETAGPGTWVILDDEAGVGSALVERLEQRGQQSVRLVCGEGRAMASVDRVISELAAAGPLRGVVHACGLAADAGDALTRPAVAGAHFPDLVAALHLIQALVRNATAGSPRLFIVTRGAAVGAPGITSPEGAALWGFGRVVALEHPETWGGLIDLDPSSSTPEQDAQQLADELIHGDGEDQVAHRGAARRVARFVRTPARATGRFSCRPDATYLITGGLGAIGLELAAWMADRGARHLVLAGRSALPEREASSGRDVDGVSSRRMAAIEALEARGVWVQVAHVDVTDHRRMADLFDRIQASSAPLRGVVHAAGIVRFDALASMSAESLHDVCAPKVTGGMVLHQLTRSLPLDFFVMMSSAAAIWGGVRQGHYAAANHFLDALSDYRRERGLPALSINWGPWGELGLASPESTQWLAQFGVTPLSTEDALAALDQVIGSNAAQVTIATVDWSRFAAVYTAKRERRLLDEIAGAGRVATDGAPAEKSLAQQLAAAIPSERRDLVLAFVQDAAAAVLALDGCARLDLKQGFSEQGMDSLMAVELRDRLQRGVGVALPPTLAFDTPTVEAVADYLLGLLLEPAPTVTRSSQGEVRGGDEADIAALSEDEVKALIAGELETLSLEDR